MISNPQIASDALTAPKRKSVQPLDSLEKIQQHKFHIQQLTEQHFPLLSSILPSPTQSYSQQQQKNQDKCLPEELEEYINQIVSKLNFPSSFDHSYELNNMTSLATQQLQLVQKKQTEIISQFSQPSPQKKPNNININQQTNNNNNSATSSEASSPNKKIKNKLNNKKSKKQPLVLKQQLSQSEDAIDQLTTRSISNEHIIGAQMEQAKSLQKRSYDSLDTIDTSGVYQTSPLKKTVEYYQNNHFSSNNLEDLKANISLITKQSTNNYNNYIQKPLLGKSISVPPQKTQTNSNLQNQIQKLNKNQQKNNNNNNTTNNSSQQQQCVKNFTQTDFFSDQNISSDLDFKDAKTCQNSYEFNNIDSLFNDSMFMNSFNLEKQKKKSCYEIEELDFPENIHELDFFSENSQEII
ncbi:hypothetical protein PPERSA_05297 [Pseudocohnilembus persalinus]|uniref:Uncharacterized protein n=1 Tax=Pseudocohnilembus persalinus TaxID=266149 RepID=A0A0V0R5Y1_PSEPJ|nr:hypothetical protein PPERSA_05297 [Pseudocohnilembus persalinus]|eukprot:KRX09905.1 hypothetical protein PPERSA_05297 [Pseudocohnilembus persalinus]